MKSTDLSSQQDLLSFPCRFEIKVVGRQGANFKRLICSIIDRHLGDTKIVDTSSRLSRQGKYLSLTCTIRATSREQLDSIYLDLNSEADVLITL
ncbi:MAG: hypothetical protein CL398_03755 [Acidiferrobacteraceae bacterium]|nr:hypothetical protein [Acidiferrobacteraceae bacterium]